MFKKEHFFIFIIAGLSVIYALLSFLVFLSGGKWSKVIKKKLAAGAMIITFSAIITTGQVACTMCYVPLCYLPTPTPEITPMCYTPTPTPLYGTPESTPEAHQ